MPTYVDFGDAEAAARAVVAGAAQVTAFNPVTVSTDLIGYTASARWVQLARTGGLPTLWLQVDNPIISFDVRAESKATARDLAAAARGALFAAQGSYSGNGLDLYDVADEEGMAWAPDNAQPAAARYTFTLRLVTRPAP